MQHLTNNNYENDDLVTFQVDSKAINCNFSQLVKYSKRIRDGYLYSDVINRFPQEINNTYEEFQLSSESIVYFFQLLKQNCNIEENSILTYIQCIDLLKISKHLEIRKLSDIVNEYITSQKVNVDFILQMIQHEVKIAKNCKFNISLDMENVLSSKIDECLSNEKFDELPIPIIYRIVEKGSSQKITHDILFDFIKKSISKFCVLFPFLEIQKLSENRLEELCDIYAKSDDSSMIYFNYLKCNLNVLNEMIKNNKNLSEKLTIFEKKNEEKDIKMNELESLILSLKKQIEIKEKNDMQQQEKLKDLEAQINQMQSKLNESDKNYKDIQNKLKETEELKGKIEEEKNQIQKSFENSEKEKNILQKRLNGEITDIKGQIVASVKNGLLISAKINLIENDESLDIKKSKYILSTSNVKSLGKDEYEKGELITSLQIDTINFMCKPGTYYVRCIVFNNHGASNEFVSNPVTTRGKSVLFNYEEKPTKISLIKGKYKLEVWGAKGGNSTGKKNSSNPPGEGGLGGYSSGILTLKENEIVHVFVGGEGKSANSSDGETTDGGFPDGGGTKTGHYSSCTSVPGTGGGSTSIRIANDTDYARVIVAGGGGGASGCCEDTNSGAFGGGLIGGSCNYNPEWCESSSENPGSGTQTGSSPGLGRGSNGDSGTFGHGANGKYMHGRDSGGGGGGGWYGGGSGGYGYFSRCSSGGGGSGWTFTESSFNTWQSGDPSNSKKFLLNNSYHLTNAICLSGNQDFPRPDGNGTEKGHAGNGYAKITPE